MSRVDEARRRAVELLSRDGAEGSRMESLKPLPLSDVARLTTDAFPLETPAHGHLPAARPPRVSIAAQSQPAVTHASTGTVADSVAFDSPAGTWLDSLDVRVSHKVVGAAQISSASAEQYRLLAATLHKAHVSSGVKVIMVASAVASEGKTLTAANLALTFSESYHRRVLLVDADLRHPTLHQLLLPSLLPSPTPASNHLASLDQRALPVTQITPRLGLLTIGLPSSAPMAELTSERMEHLLQQAREAFDWIVIDTPPAALLPDASLLASMVDGAVVVVKAGSTSVELVQRAVEAIGRKKTLGLVLNAARTQTSTPYQYGELRQLTPAAGPPKRP